jgi:putative toxin-antitoxin system antitoxin component (TIGR02293 family)
VISLLMSTSFGKILEFCIEIATWRLRSVNWQLVYSVVRGARSVGNTGKESSVRGRTVGLRSNELRHVLQRIASGLPYQAVEKLQAKSGLSLTDVARVTGIPIRTMARRKDVGKLRPVESERLLRLTFIFEQAVDLFEGNSDAARDWLETSNAALGGETPLRLAETEIGAREVENLIGRLEHGVFS